MLTATDEFKAWLYQQDTFITVDLMTFTLSGDTPTYLRYTTADIPITYGGHTFAPMPIKRDAITVKVGVEVDTLSMTLYPTATDTVYGLSLTAAARQGAFDGAGLLIERSFLSSWNPVTVQGTIHRFSGYVGEVDPWRNQISMTVNSGLILLDVQMPRNVYSPACINTLYGVACGVDRTAFASSQTVGTGSTKSLVNCGAQGPYDSVQKVAGQVIGVGNGVNTVFQIGDGAQSLIAKPTVYINGIRSYDWTIGMTNVVDFDLTGATGSTAPPFGAVITADYSYSVSGYWTLGTVIFTSGANAGVRRTVKSHTVSVVPQGDHYLSLSVLGFSLPLPNVPQSGDTFTIYPGCDRLMSTCGNKFSNLAKFRGCPFIPAAESSH